MTKSTNRGGARKGAGRKKLPRDQKKHPLSVSLPVDVIDWVLAQPETRSETVEKALRDRMRG